MQIRRALNAGVLPPGYLAMAEQITGGPEPDVVTLHLPGKPDPQTPAGVAVAECPPKVHYQTSSEAGLYVRKANRITVRHPDGAVVAVIEVVSPGNKDSSHAVKSFVRKAVAFLHAGVHLLIVDLFPPSRRDPQGVHKLIWDRVRDEEFALPADKPLTLVAYSAGRAITGYIEPVAVGQPLPDMPIFLTPDRYVPCPLEATYQASWEAYPLALRAALEGPPADGGV
jgi:hypothetical protein